MNVENEWQRKRILILGMTYPSYSSKYVENVCTGGLLADSSEMVRIHPIPRRYLDPAHQFKSFQWIQADVAKHANDPRPESLRIKPDTIELCEHLDSRKHHQERRRLLEESPHLCRSVEDLHDRHNAHDVSLGIVKPKEITGVRLENKGKSERDDWLSKEKMLLAQQNLFERAPMPIDFIDVRFEISWVCDDNRCDGHSMSLLNWGLHELYRRLQGDPDKREKVTSEMSRRLDQKKYDLYLFLGSFRGRMYQFGLMDTYSCPKPLQAGPRPLQASLFK